MPKPAEPELPLGTAAPLDSKMIERITARRKLRRERSRNKTAILRVLSGLEEVESLIYDLADLYGIDPASPYGAFHSLIDRDVIPESLGKLYATLRDARNAIAHSNTIPNENEIAEYERQSSYLKAALVGLRDETVLTRKQESQVN